MGTRGPKPVDMGMLNVWEFEWYKAFHLLRDGVQLPPTQTGPLALSPREIDARIAELKRTTVQEFVAERQRELGKPQVFDAAWRAWGEFEMDREMRALQGLKPKEIYARNERREIWKALIQARTLDQLKDACQRWEELIDVRAMGFQCFIAYVGTNAKQFLSMKRDKRFPRSLYADNSRLEYLARGMAGVLVGRSPMTAIERLRNMKHGVGGPLWQAIGKYCRCWRCELERQRQFEESVRRERET